MQCSRRRFWSGDLLKTYCSHSRLSDWRRPRDPGDGLSLIHFSLVYCLLAISWHKLLHGRLVSSQCHRRLCPESFPKLHLRRQSSAMARGRRRPEVPCSAGPWPSTPWGAVQQRWPVADSASGPLTVDDDLRASGDCSQHSVIFRWSPSDANRIGSEIPTDLDPRLPAPSRLMANSSSSSRRITRFYRRLRRKPAMRMMHIHPYEPDTYSM